MFKKSLLIMAVLLLAIAAAFAQDDLPDAEMTADEGGVQVISGELVYTFGFFNSLWRDPYVLLYDGAGVIDNDFEYVPSFASQVFGRFTSDTTVSPISYELDLPFTPNGEFRDVDNNGEENTGVQVFTPGIFNNLWGDPYMDDRDDFYFAYASVVVSDDAATIGQVEGGKLLVWAPDDAQGFPSGFGEDETLFTEDDPTVALPAGWTVVDMDSDPFTFDRSESVNVDLLEPESAEQEDYSDLSYTEAFDAMIDLLAEEYAFTELKDIDWEEKRDEFRPRIEEAEANADPEAFRLALRDLIWGIPDGHLSAPIDFGAFQQATSGGLGIAVREVDDGRVIVNFVTEDSPASEEGIELRAEITEINGEPIEDAIEAIVPWSSPFSTDHVLRLQQLRYVTRFPVGEEVEIVYQNPDADEPTTATLTAVAEPDSFRFSSFNSGLTGTEYPIEFEIMDNGYGYIKIFSFSDDLPLTVELWDRAMRTFIANEVPGIVVDMRQNGGGFTAIGYQMVSYFFDEDKIIEISGFYDDSISGTFIFEESPDRFTPPEPELQYGGDVAVLIAPSCSSACEYVSRAMTIDGRAEVVGFYPTNGIGGGWSPFLMPDGIQIPLITTTAYDEDLNLIIEETGVEPTLRVPVTEETLFAEEDVLLNEAVSLLDEQVAFETREIAPIAFDDDAFGFFEEGTRDRYTLEVSAGSSFEVGLVGDDADPVLRVYVQGDDAPVAVNDNIDGPANRDSFVEIMDTPADFTFIIEAATVRDAGTGGYILTVTEIVEAEPTEEATEISTEEATEVATEAATEAMPDAATEDATEEM